MNSQYRFNNRWIIFIGYAAFFSLLLLSFIFFRERSCYMDIAFQVFWIMKTKFLAIQNYRFGAAFTQIFPLSTILLKVPLRQVLIFYSLAFYIYYLVIFVIVVHYYKNEWVGMSLVFFLTLMCSYSFYWAQSEYPQAVAFLVLFLAFVLKWNSNLVHSWISYLLLGLLLITLLFFHPLIIFPLAFSLGYLFLNKNISGKNIGRLIALAIPVILMRSILMHFNSYEAGKMGGLKNFITLFPNYLTTVSWKFFFEQLFKDYIAFTLLAGIVGLYYLRNRLYLKLLFVSGFILAYLLLIHISYPYTGKDTYMQNMILPLGLMIAIPFLFEVAPHTKPALLTSLIAVILVFRIGMIYKEHQWFSQRVNYVSSLLNYTKQYDGNRFYISEDSLSKEKIEPDWALSYETIMLSGMASPDSVRTIELEEVVHHYNDVLDSDNIFINRFWGYDLDGLNDYYFKFRKSRYRLINNNLSHL